MGSRILIILFYRLGAIGIDPPNKSVSSFFFFRFSRPFFNPNINWDLSQTYGYIRPLALASIGILFRDQCIRVLIHDCWPTSPSFFFQKPLTKSQPPSRNKTTFLLCNALSNWVIFSLSSTHHSGLSSAYRMLFSGSSTPGPTASISSVLQKFGLRMD